MRQIFLYTVLLLANSHNAISQTWHQYYNHLTLIHFQQLSDKNKIIVGSTNAISSIDSINISLIYTDSIGNVIWSKPIQGPFGFYPVLISRCADGGFIVAGEYEYKQFCKIFDRTL